MIHKPTAMGPKLLGKNHWYINVHCKLEKFFSSAEKMFEIVEMDSFFSKLAIEVLSNQQTMINTFCKVGGAIRHINVHQCLLCSTFFWESSALLHLQKLLRLLLRWQPWWETASHLSPSPSQDLWVQVSEKRSFCWVAMPRLGESGAPSGAAPPGAGEVKGLS